ncbi:MAG: leucine-rich repeat protein, partial [Eubacterium sp.]|nr:leucine-rich repeat protein [Eubacterium sp.]
AGAFDGCTGLTAVTMENGVETIDAGAFKNCSSLSSISLPDSVTAIGSNAFANCGITGFTVGDNNEYYSSEDGVIFDKNKTMLLFYPSGKTDESYSVPASVTNIGAYAFSGCSSLSDIIIPESVSSVEAYAFSGCSSLKSITFLNRSCEIKDSSFNVRTVFYGFHASTAQAYANSHNRAFYPLCTDGTLNHNFKISEPYCLNEGCGAENPDYDDTYAGECGTDVYWHYDSETLTLTVFGEGAMDDSQPWASFAPYIKYVVVEEGITAVGNGSFKNCNNITRVTLPESLNSIGANAFEGCLWLRTLSVPGSVTTLGEDLFKNCRRLIFIDYSGTKAQWNSYSESVLNSQEIKEAVVRCTDGLIYDENLYVVENGAIYTADRKRLIKIIEVNEEKKFEVPSGVETISEGTCADTDVEVVNIPETVTTVEKDSLKGEGVRLVNFPDGVSALDEDAMSGETVAVVYEKSATHIRLLEIAYPEILSFEMTDEKTNGTVNSVVINNRALLKSSPSYTRDKIRKNFAYSGVDIRPCITIRENGTAISSGNTSDRLFEKTYKNNRYAGKASVIIIAKAAKYNDVNEILHFGIFYNASNLTCSLSKTEYSYNGFKKSPNVTVKAPDGKTV